MNGHVLPYTQRTYTWTVKGQPIPAPRLTQRSAKHPTIPRGYYAFKGAVVAALLDTYGQEREFHKNLACGSQPFTFDGWHQSPKILLEYWLHFRQAKNGACVHGDPDNVGKAIADALFSGDRHVMSRCMDVVCSDRPGYVQIRVTFPSL